ncbi:class II aldolase and adducin N-terminal domain-containing protein [bacterium]|nr:class II aldolase and adducin N-terminal domain-containing protein [bacterium]MBU1883590.1 class II aldolase and adducin N-terminal domain-containing protein [bacterium]
MNKQVVQSQIKTFSLSMFRKDFFGIYHGSISAKTDSNQFIINTDDAIFDSLDERTLIELNFQKDYRWKQASLDADIHKNIYSQISDAKFITFTMPPFTTAYSLDHNVIIPKDYFGYMEIGRLDIVNPQQFEDWYDRAESEITKYLKTNDTDIMVIRGYGIYAYNRDIHLMAKKLAILEKSCRLLMLERDKKSLVFD